MSARSTTDELARLADQPMLDDAQLEFMVTELGSTDSWVDQEDGGYGSTYSAQYEIKVSACAEQAIGRARATIVPRLVQRLERAEAPIRDGLLKALSRTSAASWTTLTAEQRAHARRLIDGSLGTLQQADDELTVDRARDLLTLRLMALEEGNPPIDALVSALCGPSSASRAAAVELMPFLRGSLQLGTRVLDAFLSSREYMLTFELTRALAALEVPGDDLQRARLAAVLEDPRLGDHARSLLTRGLSKAEADAKYPWSARRIAAEAQSLVTNTNEGAWRHAISQFGRPELGAALVLALRPALAARSVADSILQHMSLVGPSLAPLAEQLLPYLSPATSPSWRHVRWATAVFESIKSPIAVPALEALLKTDHERHARLALDAIHGKR